jgi:mRNA interferase RelE/StbE
LTVEWQLLVAPSADRILRRLPEKVAAAVVEFMVGPLLEEPRRVGRPLQRELSDYWSARRGAYRIVYRLDEGARVVRVVRIEHRADVYRRR